MKWQGTPPLKTHLARLFPAAVLGCERVTGTLGAVSLGTRATWEELRVEELEEEADLREREILLCVSRKEWRRIGEVGENRKSLKDRLHLGSQDRAWGLSNECHYQGPCCSGNFL